MSLKIALVGCGKIADGHIEEIQKLPAIAHVAAVCDLELLMAEQVATRYGIARHFDDFTRMLDDVRPDVVHIATPPQSHLALARQAIDAGCHVFVEKPLALSYRDAVAMVDYARAAGKKLTVGYTYRFDPPAERMRELIASGVLGDPVHVESFYGYDLSGAFGTALLADSSHWVHRLPGKLFHNNIDHLLYKVTEFIDDDRPCIRAMGAARRSARFGDDRDQMLDELRVMIQGRSVTAYATFSAHARPVGHFTRIYGTRNTLHVDYSLRTVTVDPSPKLPSALGRLLPPFQQARQYLGEGRRNVRRFLRSDYHFFAGLNRLIAAFYNSVLEDRDPPIPYAEILRVAAMTEEIFRQVDQGSVIR